MDEIKGNMKAYKFKSATQISQALDIIFNNRLYCADWSTLNDPMEGMFAYSHKRTNENDVKDQVAAIVKENKQLRICSLSETFDSHLLWSHYASGFSGLAIEIELPNSAPEVQKITYRSIFADVMIDGCIDPQRAAKEILGSKYREWKYEKEIRIINRSEFFHLENPVEHVIAGHRMEPALFEALNIICNQRGIRFSKTGIGDEGIDADYVKPSKHIDDSPTLRSTATRRKRRDGEH